MTAASIATLSPAGDGRRLRREQNREAVIDALVGFFEADRYHPSATEIAVKAGLSPRSLFRYFDDVDDLYRAAVVRQIQLTAPLLRLDVGPDDTTSAKIDAVARSRVRLFMRVDPVARAMRACAQRDAVLAGELDRGRAFLTGQLSELFAAELGGFAASQRDVLAAIDVLCSFESYDVLSRDPNRSPAAIVAVLRTALTALLTGPPDA